MADILTHPIPAVVLLLGLLVFVHEFGHFIVGKWCGIGVEVFSIGFGPRIFGFRHQNTDYRLSWIPLGGYVKFAGAIPSEDVADCYKGQEFYRASVQRRIAVASAGPLANFLLAVVAYGILGYSGISWPPPLIGDVIDGSAADRAGFEFKDRVVSIDGEPVKTWRDLNRLISQAPGQTLDVVVEREERQVSLKLVPEPVEADDGLGKKVQRGRAGVALGIHPSIVAVTTQDSVAAKAGIQTGERITSIVFGEQRRMIQHYPELLMALDEAQKAAVPSLQLGVTNADGESNPRDLILATAPWQDWSGESRKALASRLGITDAQLVVSETGEDAQGDLRKGDRIIAWEGRAIHDVFDLHELLVENRSPSIMLQVQRGFETRRVGLKLTGKEIQGPAGKETVYPLDVRFLSQAEEPERVMERYENPFSALAYGVAETGRQTAALAVVVGRLIVGEIPLKALGGPMLIAKVAGDSAKRGWQSFLRAMALISVNLGLLNLFPIPVLDGGQLVLFGLEAIRRRPLGDVAIENFQKIGFVMVLALVVLATYNDLSRFWKSMLESVVGAFE